jgi:hypothetical protein
VPAKGSGKAAVLEVVTDAMQSQDSVGDEAAPQLGLVTSLSTLTCVPPINIS